MFSSNKRLTALLALVCFTQFACYNTYFIDKNELEKLESDVEPKEVVTVYGDCQGGASAYNSVNLDGSQWAAAEGESGPETASDATAADGAEQDPKAGRCSKVPVSTANAVRVLDAEGNEHRVTPFNFMMSEKQLVSPEYDLLLSLDEVEGAEVKEFSTWKTVGTIVGVTAASIGTFVAISVLAPEGENF